VGRGDDVSRNWAIAVRKGKKTSGVLLSVIEKRIM